MGPILSDTAFWNIAIGLWLVLFLLCYVGWKSATGRPLSRFQRALLKMIRNPR